jgi:hypothetical protein
MNRSKGRDRGAGKSKGQLARRSLYFHLVALVLGFAAIGAGVFYLLNSKQTEAQATATPVAPAEFQSLKGRWQRPDGGYVIEIKGIDGSGKMMAAYFNPRSINVYRAEAALDGTTIKVFIELRDTNYPGSTYNLTYDSENDELKGVYFQAALQQSFEVSFNRLK